MSEEIVNKVAASGLITLNLEEMRANGERVLYDIKQNLFQEIILKEKDFRAYVKSNDWKAYEGKNVAIICSSDAIVPTWAYMLLASVISPYANHVIFGDLEQLEQSLYQQAIDALDPEDYRDKRLVIKGCGDEAVPVYAYAEIVRKLQPVAKSIMYGEPCSTVPVFKKR
jgi:hypothetical protein